MEGDSQWREVTAAMLLHCPQLKPAAGGEVSATELHTGKQQLFHALHSVRES